MKTTLIFLAVLSLILNGSGMYLNFKSKRIIPFFIGFLAFAASILLLIFSINL